MSPPANTIVTGIGFRLWCKGGVNALMWMTSRRKISNMLFDAGTVNSRLLHHWHTGVANESRRESSRRAGRIFPYRRLRPGVPRPA